MLEELCKRIQHCCATLRRSRNKRNVGSCWVKSLTGFKLCATTRNNIQQHATRCANERNVQHPTKLRPFARGFRIQLAFNSRKLTNIWVIERHGIRAMNFETAWIHFLRNVFDTVVLIVAFSRAFIFLYFTSALPKTTIWNDSKIQDFYCEREALELKISYEFNGHFRHINETIWMKSAGCSWLRRSSYF